MKFIKKFILILIFILPISNSFGAMHTFVHEAAVTDGTNNDPMGVHFNPAGTKMFILSQSPDTGDFSHVSEYNLSIPFDISTKTYAGNGERCILDNGDGDFGPVNSMHGLKFSHDGMMLFVGRGLRQSTADDDKIFRFDLTSPYDISTCNFPVGSAVHATLNLDSQDLQNGSNANADDIAVDDANNVLRGFDISNDGKRLFVLMHGIGNNHFTRLLEYQLSIAYDLSTISLVTDAGIRLQNAGSNDTPVGNAKGLDFSPDGKRFWVVDHGGNNFNKDITQVSLDVAFSTSSFTIDGTVEFINSGSGGAPQPSGLTFSTNGLKMYTMNDEDENVMEYDLVCPFNIIAGKCPPITENKDRTAMVEAQIEIAKRTIDHSTDTALNRLKWIRRNKDKKNLTNLNIDLNFNNQMINSFTEALKTSTTKKKEDKKQDVFYWSEGSIVVGKIGDTSISSAKKIGTDAITIGRDQFTDKNGIKGLAFRVGRNDVDVGTLGSNLDTDTYNLTYYATSPIKDDTKFLDTIVGIGKLSSNLLTVLDGKNLTADRNGGQLYGTIRIKDEIKKNNFTLIPSGRFDIGHTILGSYKESGNGAIDVKKQHVRSKKIRTGLAVVEDLSSDNYTFKRHGKLEYVANIDRSSNFKYTYISDGSTKFNETLHTGSLHNLNGEIGIDIIMPNSFSIFLIYERNQELGTGHTDKIHIALGYLPNKKTNYAFNLEGSENIGSEFKISKNINDFEIDFKLNNQDVLKPNIIDTASINLIHKF